MPDYNQSTRRFDHNKALYEALIAEFPDVAADHLRSFLLGALMAAASKDAWRSATETARKWMPRDIAPPGRLSHLLKEQPK